MSAWATLVACTGLAGGCGVDSPSPQFFPLNEGLMWQYRLVTDGGRGRRETELGFRALAATSSSGRRLAVRSSTHGTRYFFEVTEEGVFRVAKQTIADRRPQRDATPRAVLKHPIRAGTSWTSTTHPYVVSRQLPMGIDVRRSVTLTMSYTIMSIDETVVVPAGVFAGCVKVVGQATYELYADGRSGFVSIPITTEEWYAPGVGLVKLLRTEEVSSDVFTGGTAVLELTGFNG